MGQIVKRKKKGRPAKADPGGRGLQQAERDLRRSHRRRNVKYVFDLDDYFDEDEVFADDDEDQRRREKKLKLLLQLQGGGGDAESTSPRDLSPASSSDDGGKPSKKRRIDEEMDADVDEENEEGNYNYEDDDEVRDTKPESKAEDSLPGTPASGLPMPEKKTLELILDKLQRKDIYGVYAEPVDPDELPDYHDVIEHPMDFATVRNKLRNDAYLTFEQFESDVFLICSNAMRYNAPDTIYHKQARTIQELAKRKFHKVRLKTERIEKDIKPEQKTGSGSVPKKQIKRSVSRTLQEPVGSDFSSGATLATAGDIQNVPSTLQAVGSEKTTLQAVGSEKTSGVDVLVEGSSFLNDNNLDKVEESLPGKGRFGRRSFLLDENRRTTYNISLSLPVASSESIFSTFDGEMKQLIPVGLYSDHSYARSMSRFAASLGSIAWKVASKRIEQALPQGFKFGQGWVGEYEPLPTPVLMLENCRVNEPPFLMKPQPFARSKNVEKIPTIPNFVKETPLNEPFLGQKLPFLGPTGIRPPIRGNISEMNPSYLIKPSGPHNLGYHHQNLQSQVLLESEKKVEPMLNNKPSGPHNLGYHHQNLQSRVLLESEKKVEPMLNNKPSGPHNLGYHHQNLQSRALLESEKVALNSPPMLNDKPSGPHNVGYHHQNLQSRALLESEKKVELNSPPMLNNNAADSVVTKQLTKSSETEASRPMDLSSKNINFSRSGSFKQPDNGVAYGGPPNGKVISNRVDGGNTIASDLAKPGKYYTHEQGQGLSDPVQMMRKLAENKHSQQKPSKQSPKGDGWNGNDPSNAAAAAARAWMSVGAGGLRPVSENAHAHANLNSNANANAHANVNRNQMYGEAPYHSPRDMRSQVSHFRGGEIRPGSPLHAFVPHGTMPMIAGNHHQVQFQNQRMVFPAADLSRFQNWGPQVPSRQKQESLPPDLNIGFQSSGSPGRPSSGVLVDSQQPDLALQL